MIKNNNPLIFNTTKNQLKMLALYDNSLFVFLKTNYFFLFYIRNDKKINKRNILKSFLAIKSSSNRFKFQFSFFPLKISQNFEDLKSNEKGLDGSNIETILFAFLRRIYEKNEFMSKEQIRMKNAHLDFFKPTHH